MGVRVAEFAHTLRSGLDVMVEYEMNQRDGEPFVRIIGASPVAMPDTLAEIENDEVGELEYLAFADAWGDDGIKIP